MAHDEDTLEALEGWMWNALVVLFYLPVALGSLLYLTWRGGEYLLWARTLGDSPVLDLALGAAVAVPLVAASWWLTPRVPALDRMGRTLASTLGDLTWTTSAVLAFWSAVGEELLFRAVLQEQLGIVLATLLFAAAHVPFERALWPWPLFALGSGLLLGGLYEGTGAVAAPVACHFVVNWLNLRWLVARARPSA